ncbi:MAG: hypothetical protein HY873_02875 [Chloroflexi bacterium]|nr:hypothetical protein [Chloroflexota bacterium]
MHADGHEDMNIAPEPGSGANWVEDLMRSFRDKLVGGLYAGIYGLEPEPLQRVMDAQAEVCVSAFLALSDIPAELTLEEFLDRMKIAGPSRVVIERTGEDEFLWRELHAGECVCPFVRQEVIPLDPKLCLCGATWVRLLIERHAHRRADVELQCSVATGSDDCVYRVVLHEPLDGTHAVGPA